MNKVYFLVFIIKFISTDINLARILNNKARNVIRLNKFLDGKGSKYSNFTKNQHISLLKQNIAKLGYSFATKMPIQEVNSCREINEKIRDNEKATNNLKKLFELREDEDRKDLLDFVLKHPSFISYLDNDIDAILSTFDSIENMKKDVYNRDLVDLYDAMLKDPEFVEFIKSMDKDSLQKLTKILQLYINVKDSEKKPIENIFELVYRGFVYHTGAVGFAKLYKENKRDISDAVKNAMMGEFGKYLSQLSLLAFTIKQDPKNEEAIKSSAETLKAILDKQKEKIQADFNAEGISTSVARKIESFKLCSKKPFYEGAPS